MIRILLLRLFLFLLPFLIYAIWFTMTRRGNAGEREQIFNSLRSRWLAGAGIGLVFISVIIAAFFTGHSPDAAYVPPRVVDGEIVPGYFEDEENDADEEEPQP